MTSVFMNSDMLKFLALIPLLLVLISFAASKRRKAIALLIDTNLAKQLIDPTFARKRRVSELFIIAAFTFTVLGLARPSWDTEYVLHPKTGRDLVFLLDISQSMLAEDQPPNRLTCAKNSILQCLDDFKTGRVGLVVFAGSTSIRCPLTRDFEFFRSTLDDLAPDSVPVGGTRIGDAITKTVEKVLTDDETDYRDIILITDGEDQDSINTNSLAKLVDSGARLIIIGLGSDSIPAEIPIKNEINGKIEPLIYRDRIIRTKQNSATLEKIAKAVPESIYLNVGTRPLDLSDVYMTHIASRLSRAS
jgi:Ca-activated chloride channel family protein